MIQDGPTPLQCQQHLLRFDVCELEKKTHIASGVSCSTRISGSAMTSGLPTNQCSNGCFGSEGLSLRPRLRNGFGRTDLGMHETATGRLRDQAGDKAIGEVNAWRFLTRQETRPFTFQFTLVVLHANIIPPTFKHPWMSLSLSNLNIWRVIQAQQARESRFRFDKAQKYQAKWQKLLPLNGIWITGVMTSVEKSQTPAVDHSMWIYRLAHALRQPDFPWPCTLHLQRRVTLPSVQASEKIKLFQTALGLVSTCYAIKKCSSLLLKISPWLMFVVTSQPQN